MLMNRCDSKQNYLERKKTKKQASKISKKKGATKTNQHSKGGENHFRDSGDGRDKRFEIVFESAEQRVHKQKDTDT